MFQIGGGGFGVEIAPALEGALRAGKDTDQFRVVDQAAIGHSLVRQGAKLQQALPGYDESFDDPVDATAIQYLLGAAGCAAGDMHQFGLLAFAALPLKARRLPIGQIGQGIGSDRKFD